VKAASPLPAKVQIVPAPAQGGVLRSLVVVGGGCTGGPAPSHAMADSAIKAAARNPLTRKSAMPALLSNACAFITRAQF
jgi:hypothetical protein